MIKVLADGVMEYPAQTAALLEPYLDARGKPTDQTAIFISTRSTLLGW